jgi:hypothetical protein
MIGAVSKKLGIQEGARTYFANAPSEVLEAIGHPHLDIVTEMRGDFDYIHLFAKSQDEFNDLFPKLKKHLKPTGALWVSWPKNGKLGTDLKITTVIKLGYDHGLVESKTISINAVWSAIKFTHPKAGKVYKNSYGKLKS